MKDYIYCLYNKLANRYEGIMSFPSDSMALHRLGTSPNMDKKVYDLCRIGSIEIETGVIVAEKAPVRLIWEDDNTELPVKEMK